MIPCNPDVVRQTGTVNGTGVIFTLVWYLDSSNISSHLQSFSNIVFQRLGRYSSCFSGGSEIIAAAVPDHENIHPCGPCVQFYKLFTLLRSKFNYFFQYEPDLSPVQPYWLHALARDIIVSSPSNDFWIKGSNQRCNRHFGEIAARHDWHLNGNSIFKLGDHDFEDFLKRVQTFFPGGLDRCPPGCGTGRVYEGGYDHAMFRFLQAVRLLMISKISIMIW
jgi:hypothetical protein